jgi:hypothetical protein
MRRATLLLTLLAVMLVAAAGLLLSTPSAKAVSVNACSINADVCVLPGEEVKRGAFYYSIFGVGCEWVFRVDWGDGATDEVTTVPYVQSELSHHYALPGSYTIRQTQTETASSACHPWNLGTIEATSLAEIVPPIEITKLSHRDIDDEPLAFLSTDSHTYFDGNTRIFGTITVNGGRPLDEIDRLELELTYNGVTTTADLSGAAEEASYKRFGADGELSVDKSEVLFKLPSARANLLDSMVNGDVQLRVKVHTKFDLKAEKVFPSVPRLVRYDTGNRYGDRDVRKGGDDWVKPSVRTVAEHFRGINWGEFSNMNCGVFKPHDGHRTDNDIDDHYAGYNARDAAAARKMTRFLNDKEYGKKIATVFVTYENPAYPTRWVQDAKGNCNAKKKIGKKESRKPDPFWNAIKDVKLNDGRRAADVIVSSNCHDTHFHWVVSDD